MSTPELVRHPNEKRFEEFFVRDSYVALKNHLYNYRERQRVIGRRLAQAPRGLVLEVGSGLSPIVTGRDDVIYSELSHRALLELRRIQKRGRFVVADGTKLPFADGVIAQVVCSEVLEHVENDQVAIAELGRVLQPGGTAYITVPHKRAYYGIDDRYVRHFRRYEISEMQQKIERGGLHLGRMQKVLGPVEKVTMWTVVLMVSTFEKLTGRGQNSASAGGSASGKAISRAIEPLFKWFNRAYGLIARADAAVMPRSWAAVILFEADKPKPSGN